MSTMPFVQPVLASAIPVLASLDIGKTVGFYTSKLGFEEVFNQQGVYAIVKRDNVVLHFWACNDRNIAEATSCRIQVKGVHEFYNLCTREKIVHPKAPLQKQPWGTVEFGALDLHGNLLTFYEEASLKRG